MSRRQRITWALLWLALMLGHLGFYAVRITHPDWQLALLNFAMSMLCAHMARHNLDELAAMPRIVNVGMDFGDGRGVAAVWERTPNGWRQIA